MMKTLHVTYTQDRHNLPMVIIRDLPGLDAEFSSFGVRSLANALACIEAEIAKRIRDDEKPSVNMAYDYTD